MKLFVEIHALQNYAPSNLNRDDTGAPKDALFGGTRRARVSSQCFKRAIRQYFEQKKDAGLFSAEELAVRTKRVIQAIAELLDGRRNDSEVLEKASIALSYVKLNVEDGKTQYLLFLGRREVAGIAEMIHEHWDRIVPLDGDPGEQGKKKGKKAAAGSAPKDLVERMNSILDAGKAVDVALFGRMLADMPKKNWDAACQVAHAISTHAVEREFDFYTAVDDLKPDDTSGADMMGTVEFNSACFYRYAVVDWEKLVDNLQGDEELAAKGLAAFLEGFVIAEPTGKQNTFAAHNPPEFMAVSVRRGGAPRNLANAFETAIRVGRNESLTRKSAEELAGKAKALQTAFGGEERTFVLDIAGARVDGMGTAVPSLEKLLQETLKAVRG